MALFSLGYIYTGEKKKEAEKSFPSSKRENNSDHIIMNKFFFYNVKIHLSHDLYWEGVFIIMGQEGTGGDS